MLRFGLLLAGFVLMSMPVTASAQVADRAFAVVYTTSAGTYEGILQFLEDTGGGLNTESGAVAMSIGPDAADAHGSYVSDIPLLGRTTTFEVEAESDDGYLIILTGTVTESIRPRGIARVAGRGVTSEGVVFVYSGEEI